MALSCAHDTYNIYRPRLINDKTKNWKIIEILPLANIEHGHPVEFFIPGRPNCYYQWGQALFIGTAKISKADGTPQVAAAATAPVNLVSHSMWSNIDVEVGGKKVSDPNGLYPYRAYFETLLSYPKEKLDKNMALQGWSKDTPGKFTDFAVAGENSGHKARYARVKESGEWAFWGIPHIDLTTATSAMPSMVDIRLKFIPNKDSWVLKQPNATADNSKMDIAEMALYVPYEELTADMHNLLESQLSKELWPVPMTKVVMKTFTIGNGVSNSNIPHIFNGILPDRIVMALVKNGDLNGGYQAAPFNFHNFGVNSFQLRLNDLEIPNKSYQPNFEKKQYLREYLGLLGAMNVLNTKDAIDISYEEFADGYCIYAFDLTADHNCGGQCLSTARTGDLRAEIHFAADTTSALELIVYGQFNSEIQFDRMRNVLVPGSGV